MRMSPVQCGDTGQASEGRMFFFEKKNQKTFSLLARDAGKTRDSIKKFFASFFQKRSALPSAPNLTF
jgi:hypothetical protein